MDLNIKNFGKNLKIVQKLNQTPSEKEVFTNIINALVYSWNKSIDLANGFGINVFDYEESFYIAIENLLYLKYGAWKTEIILWYVFGRIDNNGKIQPLIIQNKSKKDELVYLKTPNQLWNALIKIEKINKDLLDNNNGKKEDKN